jgi:hypothetical protein
LPQRAALPNNSVKPPLLNSSILRVLEGHLAIAITINTHRVEGPGAIVLAIRNPSADLLAIEVATKRSGNTVK